MLKQTFHTKVIVLSLAILISSILINTTSVYAISKKDALQNYKVAIIASSRKTGTWASVTAAQFLLESHDPLGALEEEGYNFFGIKWSSKHAERYPGAKPVEYNTKENYGNGSVSVKAKFTHFPKKDDGITEHSIIWWNGSYEPEKKILLDLNSSMEDFLKEMGNGPYATDPNYYSLLKSIIKDNNLEEWDKLAFPDGRKYCGFGEEYVGTYSYPNDGYNSEDVKNIGTTVSNSQGGTDIIVAEEDLVGMYPDVFFSKSYDTPDLPTSDSLTIKEKVSVSQIKNILLDENKWSMYDTARVGVVFIGLLAMIYGVLVLVAYFFDKVNTLVEISLISVVTFGCMRFSHEDGNIGRGYVNNSNILKIVFSLFAVGFFLISGALFNWLTDIVYIISNFIE